jgi:hypothetical protein
MRLWFVTAAHDRFAVTRLALTQRASLIEELAGKGIEASCVVVACDDNVDIARQFGFDVIEMDNTHLGRRVNAGTRHGCLAGADWVCWCGADDWLHPWLFVDLKRTDRRAVIAGRFISIVDLERPRLRELIVRSNVGAPPWIISRPALEKSEYAPVVKPETKTGIDGWLAIGIQGAEWRFEDPRAHARVDFKSPGSMTPYDKLSGVRGGHEILPWPALADAYGDDLAVQARETHEKLMAAAA